MHGRIRMGLVALLVAPLAMLAAPRALLAAPRALGAGVDLGGEIQAILRRSELDGAEVGVSIRAVRTGEAVFSHEGHQCLIPASNQKILTLAMGLVQLGEDYHFETLLLREGAITAEGVLEGNLWIVGGGDPTLQPPFRGAGAADALVPFVQALGKIRRVRGDIIVDASIFDDERVAAGWPLDQLDRYYCAPISGLSLNSNCLSVLIAGTGPGDVRIQPRAPGYQAISRLTRSSKSREVSVWLTRPDETATVLVRGQVGDHAGTSEQRVAVREPDLFFGRAYLGALADHGVVVDGGVRRDQVTAAKGRLTPLGTVRSPLLPALYYCGKESDNGIAEHIFKLAAVHSGLPGSFAAGAANLSNFLASRDVDVREVQAADGSGLSRENRISAEAMVQLLSSMYQSPLRDSFIRALPISGVDGTLDDRMAEPSMRYRVRAKTGYLRRVSSLSGYLMAGMAERPEVYAFSILINGFRGSNALMKGLQDDICRAVVRLCP